MYAWLCNNNNDDDDDDENNHYYNNNENTMEKAKICYLSDYIHLTNPYFCMNNWHY